MKDDSEVQDDSDVELRKRLVIGNLETNNSTTNIHSLIQQKPQYVTQGTFKSADEDTEGESVLIGDEDPVFNHPPSQKLNKQKTQRSPLRTSKLSNHNKHTV